MMQAARGAAESNDGVSRSARFCSWVIGVAISPVLTIAFILTLATARIGSTGSPSS